MLCDALSWSYLLHLSPHLHLFISALEWSPFPFFFLLLPCLLAPLPHGLPFRFSYNKNESVLKCHFPHEKLQNKTKTLHHVFKRKLIYVKKKHKQGAVSQQQLQAQRSQDTVCTRLLMCMCTHRYSLLPVLTDLQVSSHCIKSRFRGV